MGKSRVTLGIVALLAITAACMTPLIRDPWVYRDDYASAAYAVIARNHFEFGLGVTRGASALTVDRAAPEESPVYAHHPFLWPIIESLAFKLFGATEFVARALCVLTAIATIYLLFRLVSEQFTVRIGFSAAALYAVSPANLFDGRTNSLEQPASLFIVAGVYAYLRWLTAPSLSRLLALVAVLAIGMQVEWQTYYLAVILPMHYVWVRRSLSHWRALSVVAITAPVMFAVFLAHLRFADASQFADLKNAFLFRAGLMSATDQIDFAGNVTHYGLAGFLETMFGHAAHLLTVPFLLVSIGGLLYCVAETWKAGQRFSTPLLLIAPALIHTAVFSNAMYVHECMVILYLPGLSVAAAIVVDKCFQTVSLRDARFVGAVLFFVVYAMLSARRTAELYADQTFDPWVVGTEIGRSTLPSDEVLVLGLPYHPAVEWYAKRDVAFADRSPVGRTNKRGTPTVVAVLDDIENWMAVEQGRDAGAQDFATETRRLLSLTKDAASQERTDHLTLYRLKQ